MQLELDYQQMGDMRELTELTMEEMEVQEEVELVIL